MAIPPNAVFTAQKCVGGAIGIGNPGDDCPYFPFSVSGEVWFEINFIVQDPVFGWHHELAEIELSALAKYEEVPAQTCQWKLSNTFKHHSRTDDAAYMATRNETERITEIAIRDYSDYWADFARRRVYRRRIIRHCTTTHTCDISVTGFLTISLLSLVEIKLALKYFFRSKIVEIRLIINWISPMIELWNSLIYRRDLNAWDDGADEETSADVDSSPLQAVAGWGWKMHWGKEATLEISYKHIFENTHLKWARNNAMRECLVRTGPGGCGAVTCWSSTSVHSGRNFVWRCQLRNPYRMFGEGDTAYRIRTYTPDVEGYTPPVPVYTGPDFVGAGVWGEHWGMTVSNVQPSGPSKLFRESTIILAKRKAMESCKYHNKVTWGRLCKAIVCWSTQSVQQEETASAWECQMRSSNIWFADWTTDWRVRTYTPEACQKCNNDRWKHHWGKDVQEKVTGSSDSQKVFLGEGRHGLSWATKQGKEACGHHNSVTTGNLCKAVVCWSTQNVHNEPTPSAWECQMRSSNVLGAGNTDYRVQTYTPEACS